MSKRKTKKQTRYEQMVAFAEAVGALVDLLGGRLVWKGGHVAVQGDPAEKDPRIGAAHREIMTRAGRLEVHAYGDWVHTRFDDVPAAERILGTTRLNPHSGKWNFHFDRTPPGRMEARAFGVALQCILPDPDLFDEADIREVLARYPDLRKDEA